MTHFAKLLLVALIVVAGACGGDDDDERGQLCVAARVNGYQWAIDKYCDD